MFKAKANTSFAIRRMKEQGTLFGALGLVYIKNTHPGLSRKPSRSGSLRRARHFMNLSGTSAGCLAGWMAQQLETKRRFLYSSFSLGSRTSANKSCWWSRSNCFRKKKKIYRIRAVFMFLFMGLLKLVRPQRRPVLLAAAYALPERGVRVRKEISCSFDFYMFRRQS